MGSNQFGDHYLFIVILKYMVTERLTTLMAKAAELFILQAFPVAAA